MDEILKEQLWNCIVQYTGYVVLSVARFAKDRVPLEQLAPLLIERQGILMAEIESVVKDYTESLVDYE